METLKKIVRNQYFPAGAVLTAVVLFWLVGILGGLSLLHNNQPPLTTLTWMLFVYTAAVLTPLAGLLAAVDLIRRWRRNRAALAAPADTHLFDGDAAAEYVFEEGTAGQAPGAGSGSVTGSAAQPAAASAQVPEPNDHARATPPEEPREPARPATPPRPAGQPMGSSKKPKQPGGRQAA